jgi:hypothetical protein
MNYTEMLSLLTLAGAPVIDVTAPLPIEVTPKGITLAHRIGNPASYPSDAEYAAMQASYDRALSDETYDPFHEPTFAERLAESMKDDRRP